MTAATLRETVAAQVAQISPAVMDRVVAHLVAEEERKRADAIVKGVGDLNALQRERNKIARPDAVTYNADRSVAAESYSKARLDEIEKLDKRIDKLTKALDKALAGDMGDLLNVAKGGEPKADAE